MPKLYEQLSHPGHVVAVTPHDTNEVTKHGILYIGGTGDVAIESIEGDSATFVGVPAGSFLPIPVAKVKATGTTATNILVLY